jgi:hypothetical protein
LEYAGASKFYDFARTTLGAWAAHPQDTHFGAGFPRFVTCPWRRERRVPTVRSIDKPATRLKEHDMNHITFSKTRQQASAAALALSVTLGMLLSVNTLATRPATDIQMAAGSASHAQLVSPAQRAAQG